MSTPDLPAQLRERIRESGKNVKTVAAEAGVGYLKLNRWFTGKTATLDFAMATKLCRHFTGKDLTL